MPRIAGNSAAGPDAPKEVSRLLVVDDDPLVLSFFRRALTDAAHEVHAVSDSTAALELLSEAEFDLLITDVGLPGPSGIELLDHCKETVPDMEVILVTGDPALGDAVRTVRRGAYDYLAKPVNPAKLRARVEAALKRRHDRVRQVLGSTLPIHESGLPDYRIIRTLGSGNMATVFLVERDRNRYAMKVLKEYDDHPAQQRIIKRFFQEAEILAQIEHPGVVRTYEWGLDARCGAPFILMEYVQGRSMAAWVTDGGLTLRQKLSLIEEVAEALAAVHAHGVLHRDVKPSNVLVTEDVRAKLTDFGIARLAGTSLTRTWELLGSPVYMAPERFEKRDVDERADVFSLGVLGYELITGVRPFIGETLSEVVHIISNTAPADARRHVPNLPACISEFLSTALAKDPADRQQTAVQAARTVRGLLEEIS